MEPSEDFHPRARLLNAGPTYLSPDFLTLSAAKPRKTTGTKAAKVPKKPNTASDFRVEDLFLTDS